MTAQAKPKTQELMDSILYHRDALKKITKLERNQLIRDAENLRGKIPQWDVYDFLGMIYCLYGDTTEALKNYDLAFSSYKLACEQLGKDFQESSPEDYEIQYNYFTTLNRLGFFSKSNEVGKTLLRKYPDDAEIIATLTSTNLYLGRLHDAANYLNQMEEPVTHIRYDVIVEALSIFKNTNLKDDESEKIISYASNILYEKKLFLSALDANLVDDCLWIDLYVDFPERVESPAKEIAKINWEADGILARDADSKWFDVIMFEFKSVEVLLEDREIIEKKERMSGKW